MAQRRESRLSGLRTGGNRLSDFSVAETLTPEERYVAQNPNDNQFFKGLRTASANISTGALRNEQLDAELSGDAEAEDIARRGAERIERDRGVYAPRVNSLRDINNVGDAGDFVASSFGQGLGSMAPSVAAALATRGLVKSPLATFASASAASYPQVKGEAVSEQYNDPILAAASAEDRSTMATRVGLAGSALEALVPTSLSRTLLRGPAGEGIRGAARTAGRNIITEGTTETAQTEAQFLGARALDPTRERDPMAYADAFAAGAITGGGTSAGASAIRPALGAARDVAGAVARPIADGLGRLSSRTGPTRPNDPAPVDVSGQPPEADLAPAPAPVPAKDSAFYEAKSEDLADEIMAGDTDPGLAGATREETAANMAASEERRVLGAQRLRNELMARTDVPDTLKTQMREYGSVTDPAVQKRIADVYRKVNALRDLENVLPDENATVADFTEIKDGGVKRKNLQNMQASKMPQLVNTLARVLGPQADQAPKMARQLTALAARLDQGSLDADTVETMTRTRDALGELDTTGAIQEVLAASLPALAKGMEAIQAIPSALSDVRGSEGQSFLESMMPRRMPRSVTNTVARFIDDNATGYPNMEGGRRERVLDTMTQAFGSPERAEIVMDYYGELRRQSAKDEADRAMNDGEEAIATQDDTAVNEAAADDTVTRNDEDSGSDAVQNEDFEARAQGVQETTGDILNRPEYVFEKNDEPFRAFEGSELSNKRVQSIASAEASKRRGTEVADTQTITMNQYVEETGGSPESEYQKISKRLDDRISSLAGRSKLSKIDRDRLNERRGERALIDKLYEEGGAAGVLEQYQVIKVQNASPDDSRASDVELGSMRTMLDREPNIKELTRRLNTALRENRISQREMDKQLGEAVERRDKIRQTRITFEMADGTATPLSAESMWKTVAAKSESRQNEREDVRLRRLFHEAVALVLNRPDVVGIKKTTESKVRRSENPNSPPNTAPEQIIRELPRVRLQVDGELFNRPEPNPSYRAQVRGALENGRFSLSQLKTTLDNYVDEYWAADDKVREAPTTNVDVPPIDPENPATEGPTRKTVLLPSGKNFDKYDSRKEEIKGELDARIDKTQRLLDNAMVEGKRRSDGFVPQGANSEARRIAEKNEVTRKEKAQADNPLINNIPSQAYNRERLRLMRDARNAMKEAGDVETVLNLLDERQESVYGSQDPDTKPVNQSDPKAPKDLNKQGRDRYDTGNSVSDLGPNEFKPTRKQLEGRIANTEKTLLNEKNTANRQSLLDLHAELTNQLGALPTESAKLPAGQPASELSRARVKPGAMDVESGLDVLRAVRGNRPVRTQEPYLQRIVVNKGYRQIAPGLWAPPEDSGTTIKPAMRMLGDKSLEALYNVAVEGNLARLDSASKKAAFDAMSDVAKEMIEAIPAADRTGKQAELLSALNKTARQSSMNPRRGRPKNWSQDEKQGIIEEIRRIRGEDVRVSFETFAEIGASGEFSMDEDHQNRLIRLAVNAGDMKSVAWHESLHDFFHNMGTSPEARKLKASLLASANRPVIKAKLRELLAAHPNALKQIEGRSPEAAEERLAYMYQFWAEGKLDIDTVGVNIFQRLAQLIRELIGTVSADQKVAMVMAALHEGALTNPNIVAEVMAERGQTMEEKMEQHLPFLRKSRDVVLGGATDRLRDTGLPALIEIADALHQEAEFEDSQLPFLQRRFMREGQWSNKMEKIFDGSTTAQRKTAIKNMQGMREPTSEIERELAAFFKDIRKYMIDSGVMNKNKEGAWVPMGEIKNYFPRVFDRSAILNDREGFRQLLIRDNVQSREADAIIRALTSGDGRLELAENEHHLGFTPFAASVQNRQLTFIKENNAADYAKYQSQDLADILTGYVKQAVHRAEYAVDFGNDGKWISDKLAEAGRQGATAEELKSANKQVQALEGTLGHDMNPRMKEYMSLAMTYQNVVLLPLAIFSQMVDSLGLGVRTGSLKEAGTGYTRALKDLKAFVTRDKSYDYDRELAEMLGVISKDNMLEAMGQTYGSMYMSRGARNVNRAFFKYNGMQGWNNSMRIAATVAGERYLLQHTADSRRMEELGVKPVDIKPGPDGRLAITPDQFVERGMTRAKAEQSAERVQQALFKFVDGAVVRPNAAHRAVWMSDPRFMLIAHLKQFAFSFQSVILRRATYESENDNIKPMLMLGMYVPVMFAADMAKWTLTGSVPPDWTFYDHFMHSVTRSGLLGKGEFYNEAFGDAARGNLPGQSFVLGPTGEHAADLMNFAAGDPRTDTEDVVDRSIPFARYFE
jgi:hypothetical protein